MSVAAAVPLGPIATTLGLFGTSVGTAAFGADVRDWLRESRESAASVVELAADERSATIVGALKHCVDLALPAIVLIADADRSPGLDLLLQELHRIDRGLLVIVGGAHKSVTQPGELAGEMASTLRGLPERIRYEAPATISSQAVRNEVSRLLLGEAPLSRDDWSDVVLISVPGCTPRIFSKS